MDINSPQKRPQNGDSCLFGRANLNVGVFLVCLSVLGISKPQRTAGSHERTSNFLHFKITKKLEL
jgi:hypothetical protein